MATFNKIIYPRYLLMFTPGLLIVAAAEIARWKKFAVLAVLILLPALYTDFKLLTNPVEAPLLQADRDQYLDGWPAGYGVKEVRNFLITVSQQGGKTVVATEGTFGLMPYSLELYQKDYPNVEIKAYWPLPTKVPDGINYVLIYQHPQPPVGWKLEEIMRFRQGLGNDYLKLYKVV